MVNCFHCGDEIITEVKSEDKSFCCQGCASVYNIINGAGLSNYYKGEQQNPGISNKKLIYLDYLDSEEVQQKLISFKDENRSVVRFVLPSIHCASCVWLLERLTLLNAGIISSEIDFLSKRITIHFNHHQISLRKVGELLVSIGYEPKLDLNKRKRKINHLIIRIGVAGFCFGNIMLLSFPEYLGQETGELWKKFFSYLNIILSIPVFTYCSVPFYKGVLSAFKAKKISVDILIVFGIVTLLGRSVYEIFVLNQGGYLDSLSGLLFFLLIGKWFQAKVFSELSFEKDNSYYLPLAVLKKVGDDFVVTPLEKIRKGDIIRLRNGEVVPYKCALNSDEGAVENSFITGEELPIQVKKGDLVYCGAQVKGQLIDLVVADAENGDLSEMWRETKSISQEESQLVDTRFITGFTLFVFTVAIGAFVFWSFYSSEKAFLATTSVLIVACPCALALSAPTVYGIILRKMGKMGVYLKNANAIKDLAKIKTFVFDKTGTITNKKIELKWVGSHLSDEEKSCIGSIIKHSSHPLAKELSNSLKGDKIIEDFEEVIGEGVSAVCNKSLYKIGSHDFVETNQSVVTAIYIKKESEVLGCFTMKLSVRDHLEESMKTLREFYSTYLLSGDPNLNEQDYKHLFSENSIVKNASPTEKKDFIENQNKIAPTLMIGDGINDSLAFDSATIGLAVIEETGSFFPSCDGIIKGEDLNKLPSIVRLAKYSKNVLIACFSFSIIYNLIGLYFAVTHQLTPLFAAILMPLSSVSVVGLAVLLLSRKFK